VRAELEEARLWLWCYGANILVAIRDSWFPLSHFWSLAVEEHFYIFWPAVILGCDRKTAVRVCGVLIVAAFFVRLCMVSSGAVLAAYCLTICRIDALAIGGFIALAARRPGGLDAVVARGKTIMLGAVLALVALTVWRRGLMLYDSPIQIVGYLLLDLVLAAVLVHAVASPERGRLNAALAARPLRCLGRYAYGIYVYNSIFLLAAERSLLLPRLVAASGPILGRLAYVVLLAVSTLGTAWLSWHLLEKHFLKLKRYFPMNGGSTDDSRLAAPHLDEKCLRGAPTDAGLGSMTRPLVVRYWPPVPAGEGWGGMMKRRHQ
jgi:peptidoglycan/LPS O-acetylase OafA/YrhL